MCRRPGSDRLLPEYSVGAALLGRKRAGAALTVLDVDSAAASADPYATLKNAFAAAKAFVGASAVAGGATDGGANAVLQAYHAGLVPPACPSAVKSFFDEF
jgi:hypothetical protein